MAKLHTLQDDFSAPTLSPTFTTTGAAAVYGSGVVTLSIDIAQNNLQTSQAWDLTESGVFAKITWPATGNGTHQCSYRVATGSATNTANEARFFRSGATTLDCRHAISGVSTTVTTMTYDPVLHAWLRIRHASGTVFWDTSPDGSTWTTRASTTAITWDLTNVFLRVTGVRFGAETQGFVVVDNINRSAAKASRIAAGGRAGAGARPGSRSGPQIAPGRRTAATIQGGA